MNTKIGVYNWLQAVRRGGQVVRWHTMPMIGRETVSQHTFGVTSTLIAIYSGKPPPQAVLYAHYHDLAEQVTGDVPAPAKRQCNQLTCALQGMEQGFNSQYGLQVELTEQERNAVKLADYLDLMMYCIEQRMMGNRYVEEVFTKAASYVRGTVPVGRSIEIYNEVVEEWETVKC